MTSRDCCCCGCRTKIRLPKQVFEATGSVYGTRHAGRAWHEHSKKVLEAAGFVESRLEQSFHLHGTDGPTEAIARILDRLQESLESKQRSTEASRSIWSNRRARSCIVVGPYSKDGSDIKVTQAKSTLRLECLSIDLAGRTLESALTSAEITG